MGFYGGYIGISEGLYGGFSQQNQMDKNMDNEIKAGCTLSFPPPQD